MFEVVASSMQGSDTYRALGRTAGAAAEAIYRLSGIARFDTVLRIALRTRAVEILSSAAGLGSYDGRGRIAACKRLSASAAGLAALVRFAQSRGEIASDHADRVAGAYDRISELALALPADCAGETLAARGEPDAELRPLSERQGKILAYLSANGQSQISNLRQIFGDEFSEKTLQRDLWQLINFGLVRRHGDNRWTIYTYIGHNVSDMES